MDLKLDPKYCSAATNNNIDIDNLSILEDNDPSLVDTAKDEHEAGFSFDDIKIIGEICDKIETI